jgi:hypothetical protein
VFGIPTKELAKSGEFALLRAIWELGLELAEDTPAIMQEAMAQGHTTPAVVHVAGFVQPTKRQEENAITAAYQALSPTPVNRADALGLLDQYWSALIAKGSASEVAAVLGAIYTCYDLLDYPRRLSRYMYFADLLPSEQTGTETWLELIEGAREEAKIVFTEE